jgi:Peptidase family M23
VAVIVGLGRDVASYALWWATNSSPPEVALSGPSGAVRGTVEAPVRLLPDGRADIVAVELDGQSVPSGAPLQLDTTRLPDGDHILTVRAQDRSLRRNAASDSVRFSSDNTPPNLELEVNPASVPQGHSAVIYVHPSEPVDVQVTLAGNPLRTFTSGNDYWAAVGLDSDATVGSEELQVEGRDRVGNTARASGELAVKEYEFTQDSIQVPAAMVPLLEPAVRAAEDERLAAIYQRDNGPPLWKGPFLQPVLGPITTQFGEVRSYNGGPFQGHHGGTDFQVPQNTPVQASARGKVVFREQVRLRGKMLVLDHGGGVYTAYAHLNEWLVDPDQEVQPRQPIGKVGSTGLSTGPHLHWELWVNGKNVDPMEWTEREVP